MGVQYNMKFSYGVKNRTINKIIRDNNNNNYELLTSSMKKLDESQNAILFPPINVNVAKYFYENSPILYKCIHAIAEDTTLGEVSSDDEKLSHFWEKNQDELFYMMLDYLLFGYACAEIITNKKGEVKLLKQIPSYTVHLIKEDDCYYAHQVINANNVKLQLHGEIYPAEDEADGLCLWIGGDERYEKFSLPRWKSCMNQLASNILVNELNISIATIAPELGIQLGLFPHDDGGSQFPAPLADLLDASDVFRRNGLIFVQQKDSEKGGIDALLHLVLSGPVAIHSLHKPVRFIHDQTVIGVGGDLRKPEGRTEQLTDFGEVLGPVTGQNGQKSISGRPVLCEAGP